jgi:hypothetical protein
MWARACSAVAPDNEPYQPPNAPATLQNARHARDQPVGARAPPSGAGVDGGPLAPGASPAPAVPSPPSGGVEGGSLGLGGVDGCEGWEGCAGGACGSRGGVARSGGWLTGGAAGGGGMSGSPWGGWA